MRARRPRWAVTLAGLLLLAACARGEVDPARMLEAFGYPPGECQVLPGTWPGRSWHVAVAGALGLGDLRLRDEGPTIEFSLGPPPWYLSGPLASAEELEARARVMIAAAGLPEERYTLTGADARRGGLGPSAELAFRDLRIVDGVKCYRKARVVVLMLPNGRAVRRVDASGCVGDVAFPAPETIEEVRRRAAEALGVSPYLVTIPSCSFGVPPRERKGQWLDLWSTSAYPADWARRTAVPFVDLEFNLERVVRVDASTAPPDLDDYLRAVFELVDTYDATWRSKWDGQLRRLVTPFRDSLPVWQSEEVLYALSSRSRTGAPSWARRVGAMRVDLKTGEMAFVQAAWERDLGWLSVAGDRLVTSFGRPGQVTAWRWSGRPDRDGLSDGYAIDLASGGTLEPTPDGCVSLSRSSLSPDGQWIAQEGGPRVRRYRPRAGERLARPLGPPVLEVRTGGNNVLPVFSSDGTHLYFAHQDIREWEEGAARTPWYLGSVALDGPREAIEWIRHLQLPARPERMSPFPDGRLLIWSEAGLWVADPARGSIESYLLPELRDPERPELGPLTISEPAVSPSGRRIAFSGSSDGQQWVLYVMNADGSDLRRVTPFEETPVDYWTFPESGRSALDLEKERWIARCAESQRIELEQRREAARRREAEGPPPPVTGDRPRRTPPPKR